MFVLSGDFISLVTYCKIAELLHFSRELFVKSEVPDMTDARRCESRKLV